MTAWSFSSFPADRWPTMRHKVNMFVKPVALIGSALLLAQLSSSAFAAVDCMSLTGCKRAVCAREQELAESKEEYQEDLEDALADYQDDIKEAQREGKAAKLQEAEIKYDQKVQTVTAEYHEKLANLNAI